MPSPVRGIMANQLGEVGRENRAETRSQPGGWSDDVEAHEVHMREVQKVCVGQSSDPSSEDSGRRTSPEQSATTVSTASGLPSIHDLDLQETTVKTLKPVESNIEESSDDVPQLPQLSQIYYK